MGLFLGWGGASFGPSAGFLFDLQPRVHVRPEESCTSVVEMPYFVNVLDGVPFLYGYLEFRGAPRAYEDTFLIRVMTGMRLFQKGFGNVLFDAGMT